MKKVIKKIICDFASGYIMFRIENAGAAANVNYDYKFTDRKSQKRFAQYLANQIGVKLIIWHENLMLEKEIYNDHDLLASRNGS